MVRYFATRRHGIMDDATYVASSTDFDKVRMKVEAAAYYLTKDWVKWWWETYKDDFDLAEELSRWEWTQENGQWVYSTPSRHFTNVRYEISERYESEAA